MRKLLIYMFAALTIGINVYAAESFSAQTENGKVEISGQWSSAAFLNVEVVPFDFDLEAADESIGEKCILFSVRTALDGTYITVVEFPDDFSGGKYTVHISDGTEEQTKDLFYVNSKEMQSIINEMNKSGLTTGDFKTLASANAEKFGVDRAEFDVYIDKIIEPLYNARGEYTVDSYSKSCKCAVATEKLKTTSTPDDVIKENADAFGIDFEKDYDVCTDSEKTSFLSGYISADISSGEYQHIFKKNLLGARLKNCTNYTQYGDIVINYTEFLKINLTAYNKLSPIQKSAALSKLYGMKITDTDKISEAFNTCVSMATQSGNTNTGGNTTGGGGGGASYGGGNTVPTVKIIQDAPTQQAQKLILSDISGHWAASDIEALVEKGIVSGFPDGSFKPDSTVTRSQFIKMLACAIGIVAVDEVIFNDVPADNWNCGIITATAKAGIVSGFDGNFMPEAQITRQDCSVIIYNALKYMDITISGESGFDDNGDISGYAKDAVGALNNNGIINGYVIDGRSTFNPLGTATRAEAVKMITNFIKFTEER